MLAHTMSTWPKSNSSNVTNFVSRISSSSSLNPLSESLLYMLKPFLFTRTVHFHLNGNGQHHSYLELKGYLIVSLPTVLFLCHLSSCGKVLVSFLIIDHLECNKFFSTFSGIYFRENRSTCNALLGFTHFGFPVLGHLLWNSCVWSPPPRVF